MPITTTCPNQACGKVLSVPDQFANRQGKCPSCGAVVLFAAPAPQPVPLSAGPPPVPAAAAAPPAPVTDVFADSHPAVPAPSYAGPAGAPMATADLVPILCLGAGLFFLFLLLVATFLPWWSIGGRGLSGMTLGQTNFLMILGLAFGGLAGSTFLLRNLLPVAAVLCAAFGVFLFLMLFSEIILTKHVHAGAGLIIAMIASLFIAGAFITLSVFKPLEWPYLRGLNLPPFLLRFGALLTAAGAAFVLGLLYLILLAFVRD